MIGSGPKFKPRLIAAARCQAKILRADIMPSPFIGGRIIVHTDKTERLVVNMPRHTFVQIAVQLRGTDNYDPRFAYEEGKKVIKYILGRTCTIRWLVQQDGDRILHSAYVMEVI